MGKSSDAIRYRGWRRQNLITRQFGENMDTLIQDVKFALRMMSRNPGFLAAAVLCLALGIGATTAIFSVVNAVLLRPLAYKNPEALVRVYTEFPTFPNGGLRRFAMSGPEYFDLLHDTRSFQTLDVYFPTSVNLAADTEAIRSPATFVSGGLMETLGVQPVMGRLIGAPENAPGAPLAINISYGLWKRMFGANSAIVGRETMINGRKCTIAGVMPEAFTFPPGVTPPAEVWVPIQLDPANPGGRGGHNFFALGRLKPGVGAEQAQSELQALVHASTEKGGTNVHRFDDKNHTLLSFRLQDEVVRNVRLALLVLLGAVAFVLLIGCVNVANLLLARAEARRREIAVRGAMGASIPRLARQFATEGVLLSLLGGALGLLLAYGGLRMIVLTNAGSIPRATEISMDWRVLLFTLSASVLTGLLFGFAPLLDFRLSQLTDALKDTAGASTGSVTAQIFRRVLVAGELAMALVLLIGCGLMIRAFWKLQAVHVGVEPRNVITMAIALPRATYPQGKDLDGFWTRLEERLSHISGVESVTLVSGLPPIRPANMNDTGIEGFVPQPNGAGPIQNVDFYQTVSKDYFKVMGIRLLEGRTLDDRDVAGSLDTVVINQTMANTFWPHESAIGHRIRPGMAGPMCTVVGVVEDVKNAGVDQPAGTEIYLPYRQPQGSGARGMNIVLRGTSDPTPLVASVRHTLQEMDASIPLSNVLLLEDVLSNAQARPRFLALLLTMFSGVALAIATVGIYGVISYSVARRSKEFGLRIALGASPLNVMSLVMRQGAALALAGVAAGVAASLALTRLMSALLFGIKPTDPLTFVAIPLLLASVALFATYVPARRATRVDPMQSLRYE
jgi:putative ABC transport system permease protein